MGFNLKDASTYKPDLSVTGQGYAYSKVNNNDVAATVTAVKSAFPAAGTIAGFTPAGHFSEDGWSNEFNINSSALDVYGGLTAVVTRDSFDETLVLPLASLADPDIKSVIWGVANVTATSSVITANHNGTNVEERFWVIKCVLNDGRKQWTVIPRGVISSIGSIEYSDGDISTCELTITALPFDGANTAFDLTQPIPSAG